MEFGYIAPYEFHAGIPGNNLIQGDIPLLIDGDRKIELFVFQRFWSLFASLPVTVESVCKNVPREGAADVPSPANASTADCGAVETQDG